MCFYLKNSNFWNEMKNRPSSGVDFDELLREAAAKKRAEMREERRRKAEVGHFLKIFSAKRKVTS